MAELNETKDKTIEVETTTPTIDTPSPSKKRKKSEDALESNVDELKTERNRLREKNRTNSQRFRDRMKGHMDNLFEQKYNLGQQNLELKEENTRLKRLLEEAKAQRARNLVLQQQLMAMEFVGPTQASASAVRTQGAFLSAAQEQSTQTRQLVGTSSPLPAPRIGTIPRSFFYHDQILPFPTSSAVLGGIDQGFSDPRGSYPKSVDRTTGNMDKSSPIAKLLAARKQEKSLRADALANSASFDVINNGSNFQSAAIATFNRFAAHQQLGGGAGSPFPSSPFATRKLH